jgi:site-specific recombinase XerD
LITYIDRVTETAGNPKIWVRIANVFRLSKDPGASFALAASLEAALAMADNLGFGRLAPLARARPVIQAVGAALRGIPEQSRLKLANAQFGTHRCSGSPAEFPLLCCFTTEISDPAIVSRIVALRSFVLLGVVFETDRSAQLKVVADGLRKAQTLPHPWADLVRHLPDPDHAPDRWLSAALSRSEERRMELEHARRHGPAQIAFLTALIGLIRDFGRLIEGRHHDRAAPPIQTAGTGVILKRPKEHDADERVSSSSIERAVPEVNTLLEFEPEDIAIAEPVQRELAFAPATAALEAEAPATVAKFDDRRTAYRIAEIGQTLRWSWDHLNTFELDVLVRAGQATSAAGSPSAANALFAMLALSTGMRVTTLARVPIASGDSAVEHFEPSGIWVKPVRRPQQAFTPEPQQRALLVDSISHIRFALPQAVASALAKATTLRPGARSVGELVGCRADSAVEFLSGWLEPLRRGCPNARLTHGRISAALAVEVSAITQDQAIVHYVAGSEEDVPPIAAYYAAIPIVRLQQAYSRACRQLLGTDRHAPDRWSTAKQYAGSQLLLKPEVLKSFVGGLKERVARASSRDLVEAHNAHALYTLWMLLAATGHRPVTDPAESLDVIDLDAGWMVINDKQSHPGKAGRLVPLSSMVVAQLGRYVNHLRSLIAATQSFAPELAAKLESVVSPAGPRAMPLFFLLEDHGIDWKRIGAAELGRSLDQLAGLRQNVLRHTLAATGVGEHWDPELLREMLGHIEHNVPAFGSTSARSPQAFAALRESLDAFLKAVGWQVLQSPLPRSATPASPGVLLRKTALVPVELGSTLRAKAVQERSTDARLTVNAAMRKALAGEPINRLSQGAVDRMVRAVLAGRSIPWDLASLDRYTRLHRRLVFLKARYALRIALPPRYAELPLEPPAFPSDTLTRMRLANELTQRFSELLYRRTRRMREAVITSERAVAEALVSLAMHSYVLDPELLLAFANNPQVTLVDADAFGLLAEFTVRENLEGSEVRRHRLHPLSAILLARLARLNGARFSGGQAAKEILATMRELAASVNAPGTPPLTRLGAAVEWLVEQFKPTARLVLPGSLAAYQEGVHQAVSLPLEDLVRILTGKPAAPRVTRKSDTSNAALSPFTAEIASTSVIAEPLPAKTDIQTTAVSRAGAMSLHREIRRQIAQIVRKRDKGFTGDAINYSRYGRQKKKLKSVVERLVESAKDHPEMATLLARWLIHLCEKGTSEESNLRASSCAKYYETLARPLLRTSPNVALSRLNDEALADAYADAIDTVPRRHQAYTLGRLKEFHRFLMDAYGLPPVDWLEIAPVDCVTAMSVDAGFVCWDEYLAVFRLLLRDPDADLRTRHLQAVVWFFIYRYGARVSEALGLRRKDIVNPEGAPIVLFRNNDYREIKSDAGIRQVPLIGPLLAEEREALLAWMEHIGEFADDDSLAAIFADASQPRELIDRRAICDRITEALRAVTGSSRARLHYGRHAFGTRCEWLMTLERLPRSAELSRVIRRIIGPADPREARALLLDTTEPSKRGPWAVSLAIGHGWPGTTFRCYTHASDLLAACYLDGVFKQEPIAIDVPSVAYAAGLAVSEAERLLTLSGERTALSADSARCLGQGGFTRVATLCSRRESAPVLPRKPKAPLARLTPELTDRALDLVHRRRRVDGLEQTLFLPGPLIGRLLGAEFTVRSAARYDIAGSGWTPTSASAAVAHARAGRRTSAETARVRQLLRELHQGKQYDGEFEELAATVCGIWAARYTPTATELVLPDLAELSFLLRWCKALGMPEQCIEVRVPDDRLQSNELQRIAEEHGLPAEAIKRSSRLRLAQDRVRRLARQRVGFLLRENPLGPLTGMNQFHRVMFTLSAYLRTLDTHA